MLKTEELRMNTEMAEKYFASKLAFTLGPVELKEMMEQENITVIDVRRYEDYEKSHIPNAISIPKKDLSSNLHKLSKDNINVVYCYTQQCHLGARAALILAENGYHVMELDGGFDVWKNDYDYDVVS